MTELQNTYHKPPNCTKRVVEQAKRCVLGMFSVYFCHFCFNELFLLFLLFMFIYVVLLFMLFSYLLFVYYSCLLFMLKNLVVFTHLYVHSTEEYSTNTSSCVDVHT